jgi:Lrp/AsnC family leucine-responsive transcriptional regulator
MKRVLDSHDQRVLDELRGDGRVSHSDLAERVHLSRNAVRQRVERLERDGMIRGYTVLTDEHHSLRGMRSPL